MMPRSRGPEVLDLLLSRTNNQWTRLSTCIFTTSWAKKWKLNELSLATARAKHRDSQVPASGGAGSCPTLPMAGQASPRPRGSKDTARKECGFRQDRRLVAMDRPLQEEEPPRHPHRSPPTSYPPLLEAFPLPRASLRAMVPRHSSVLATGLHLHRQISLPLRGFLLHRPLPGQHLWLSHRLHLRPPQT